MKWNINYDENKTILNVKLSKILGLYQILDPKSPKIFGYNVYQIIGMILLMIEAVLLSLSATGIYYWMSSLTYMIPLLGYSTCVLCTCYKMWILFQQPEQLRNCIEVACDDFMMNGHYGSVLHQRIQKKTAWITSSYVILGLMILFIYIVTPYIFNENYVLLKGLNGEEHEYHLSVFNLYFPVSNEEYNKYFVFFHVFELIFGLIWVIYSHVFDLFAITMCYAISVQLKTINIAFATLGQKMIEYHSEYNSMMIV